jgi:hypothetical protein
MEKFLTFVDKLNPKNKLLLSSEYDYIVYERTRLQLEYIDTIYIGRPNVYSSIDDFTLAGRDVSKIIKYRIEGRDFNIIFYYENNKYIFDHIKFSNYEYRLLK